MTGESAGLTLRYVGGLGRLSGSSPPAALMAACTSRAAPLMLRSSSNWIVSDAPPMLLDDVISEAPAICPKRLSSGAAREVAAVSGSTPGREAWTWIVGKSICGRGAMGRKWYATMPSSMRPAASSEVPTGRRMNGSEMPICDAGDPELCGFYPVAPAGSGAGVGVTVGCEASFAFSFIRLAAIHVPRRSM